MNETGGIALETIQVRFSGESGNNRYDAFLKDLIKEKSYCRMYKNHWVENERLLLIGGPYHKESHKWDGIVAELIFQLEEIGFMCQHNTWVSADDVRNEPQ